MTNDMPLITFIFFLSITPLGWIFWVIFLHGIAAIIRAIRNKND